MARKPKQKARPTTDPPEDNPQPNAEPNLGGRPCVSPEKKAKFLEALECGLSIEEASHVAEVHRETLRLAAAEDRGFLDSVRYAESKGKFHHLKKIRDGDDKWVASSWMLARKWWRDFGPRNPDKFTAKDVVEIVTGLFDALLPFIPEKQKPAAGAAVNCVLVGIREQAECPTPEEL